MFTPDDSTPRTVLITPGNAPTVALSVSHAPVMTTKSCPTRRRSGPEKSSLSGAALFFAERHSSDSGTK